MPSILDYLFNAASFMPHGYCLLWRPDLVAMHGVADALTALAYFSIPMAIHMVIRRRSDLQYTWLAWLFISFISLCGLTHVIGLMTLWQPVYGLEGLVKLATAGVSVVTAILVWPLLPKALAFPSPVLLRETNEHLEGEVLQRQRIEDELRVAQRELERRVSDRTLQLHEANEKLEIINDEYVRALLRLQAIVNETVDGMITIDERGQIEDYNPACEQIFGYSVGEAVGKNVKQLMTDVDAKHHDRYLQQYLTTGKAQIIGIGREVVGRRKDGSTVPLDLSISEIKLGDRRLFSGVLRDVTERKRRDAERDDLVDRLKRSNQELEQFAYIASHDLRAPLRALSILPKWLRRDLDKAGGVTPDIDEHLSDMKVQVERMDRLLTDLLDYSRIGRAPGSVTSIDPRQVVDDLRALLQPPPGFVVTVDGELPAIEAIPTEFELVLRNLISNAIKHHDCGHGQITIRGGRERDAVVFEVSDDGPGIAPEYHQRIFEMFSTLKSRDEVEGSGMGLALIKKIVDRWGGRIEVLSTAEARGTTFRFTMPSAIRSAA
ncbi:MAG: PAS domain S-box protein [Alphaproteobacteria bacterium]